MENFFRKSAALFVFGVFVMVCSSFYFDSGKIVMGNLVSMQHRLVKDGVLVWGITGKGGTMFTGNGVQFNLYDRNLNLKATYSKNIKDFTWYNTDLLYSSDKYYEFVVRDPAKFQNIFFRIDSQLKELYSTEKFASSKKEEDDSLFLFSPLHLAKTACYLRNDVDEWEIRNDSVQSAGGKYNPRTLLVSGKMIRTDNYPVFRMGWTYQLSFGEAEYSKILFEDKGRIYVYQNVKTETGEQYILCIQTSNGQLIYKTKLAMQGTQACLCSNYYRDTLQNQIIIGGTCLLTKAVNEKRNAGGLFLLSMDKDGKIVSTFHKAAYQFHYPPTGKVGEDAKNMPVRNTLNYYRFVKMERKPDGAFSVLAENYSIVHPNNNLPGKDSAFHLIAVENIIFKITPTSISQNCNPCEEPYLEFKDGRSLVKIANYKAQEDHFEVDAFADKINNLNDGNINFPHIAGSAVNDSGVTKVLLRYYVKTDVGSNVIYFYANASGENFEALQDPQALIGQKIKNEDEYEMRDAKTLYKFSETDTETSNSCCVEVLKW